MLTQVFFENQSALALARWAKNRPAAARSIIVFGHFLAFFSCFWLGKGLFDLGTELPRVLFFGLAVLFAAAFSAYPFRKKGSSASAFRHERVPFDALLVGLFLGLAISAGSSAAIDFGVEKGLSKADFLIEKGKPSGLAFSIFGQKAAAPTAEKSFSQKAKKLFEPPRFIQKIGRTFVQKTEPQERSKATGLWLFLTIVGVIALEWVLLAISCGLACNSMGGLAAVVLIGGAVGLFFGVWAIFRRLFRNKSKSWNAWLAAAIVLGPVVLAVLLSALDGLGR